jgi:hypothetical protein
MRHTAVTTTAPENTRHAPTLAGAKQTAALFMSRKLTLQISTIVAK